MALVWKPNIARVKSLYLENSFRQADAHFPIIMSALHRSQRQGGHQFLFLEALCPQTLPPDSSSELSQRMNINIEIKTPSWDLVI